MNKIVKIILGVVVVIGLVFVGYLEINHYDPTEVAYSYQSTDNNDDYISYDNNSEVGFIFYPGAKVDSEAYSYLSQINANVYIAKFPFEMAMFDANAADQIIEENPDVTTWYIGGHSLGGVFANRYAVNNTDKISGVVFLGSYPADGDQSDLPGLAMFGDQDLVVGDYNEKLQFFTDSDEVVVLENANHSGFGNYGQQKGDSELTDADRELQQQTIVDNINNFIK